MNNKLKKSGVSHQIGSAFSKRCTPYLILSTHLNNLFQRIFDDAGLLSGQIDSQIKSGLPTTWSSGTKPQ